MNDKLEALGLKTRTIGALKHARIGTITTLVARTHGELRRVFGLGRVGVAEIEKALALKGMKLRQRAPRGAISLVGLHERLLKLERFMERGTQARLPLEERPDN